VRKRVIKLLKSFYGVIDDNTRRIDIATRLLLRMLDEDDTVKDLAMKTIEELWFPSTTVPPSALRSRPGASSVNVHDKGPLLTKVAVIMGTSANFKDRQSPLEDVLHRIMVDKNGQEAASLHARYTEICETLIDGLVDASDLPGFVSFLCTALCKY
jgi:cohesin loading factor subunit SCC2